MRTSRMLNGAFAVATFTAFTACTNAPPATMPSSFPTDALGATGAEPAASPSGRTGTLTSGRLTIQLSGDVEVERTLETLVSTFYAPPPGGLTIVWTAGGDDATTVGMGGSTFMGTRETSPTLSVSVVAQTTGGLARFVSTAGECDVTIDVASQNEISGRFECDTLVATSGEVVDASASFAATG